MKKQKNKLTIIVFLTVSAILLVVLYYFIWLFALAEQKVEILPDNNYDKTIIVVADRDYEPYSFYDDQGRPCGYDIEILYALAKKMKVNVDLRLMNWTDCRKMIFDGKADMIMGLNYNKSKSSDLLPSMAINNALFVCFGKEDFHTVSVLYNKKLAALEQSGCITEFLEPHQLIENTTFYSTYTEVLQSVINGENDYAIASYSVGRRVLASLNEQNIRPLGPFIANNFACIGLSRENEQLLNSLNNSIKELKHDGTINNLTDKWLGTYVEIISFKDFLRVYHDLIVMVTGGLLLLFAILFFYIYRTNQVKILKEKELELSESRICVMLSQIRPHFLCNSLVAIQELCYINPETAGEAVGEFSNYLRGNLDSLSIKEAIPFEKELSHVENYLSLEKKRFGEKMNMVYDITVRNFTLPALTLQPVAENAVRHGITKREEGGTVTIATTETESDIIITVTDDGVGFIPDSSRQDGRLHVGIENVRSRLALMCGGTLKIKSEPGVGTTAIITVPKRGVRV